jgi:hypothetical protein
VWKSRAASRRTLAGINPRFFKFPITIFPELFHEFTVGTTGEFANLSFITGR